MKAKYYILMFALCLCAWTILIDNAILPSMGKLQQDNGAYTRYRVKNWNKGGKLDLVEDELLIYAIVKDREQLYYMERKPHFEYALKNLPPHTPVQMRYIRRFPKIWKRNVYDIRAGDQSIACYSSYYLQQKQQEIWKITGIIAGIYAILILLGIFSKSRT